jgi:uncharacterized protein
MVAIPGVDELTVIEARVLGALMEKQLTTPDVYPLTLKALTTACNQTSNRDPVTRYTPAEVEGTVLALKAKGLARIVHPGSGERATKYRQVADEAYDLAPDERAVLCVLFLRGAQTVAELKNRTERLHAFDSPGRVEATLENLARREPAMTARLERRPGQKEARWIQLLEADPEGRAAASASSASAPESRSIGRVEELEARVGALEDRLAQVVEALGDLVDLPAAETGRPVDGDRA